MKASDLFVKCLEEEGIEYIFGVPGEENADFMISLEKSDKIRFVLTRHEQGAAFMAEAHGRLTGEVGVCLGTLGPGATNLITGVADAKILIDGKMAGYSPLFLHKIREGRHKLKLVEIVNGKPGRAKTISVRVRAKHSRRKPLKVIEAL